MEAVREKRRSKPKKAKEKKESEWKRDPVPVEVKDTIDNKLQSHGACGGSISEPKINENNTSELNQNFVDQTKENDERLCEEYEIRVDENKDLQVKGKDENEAVEEKAILADTVGNTDYTNHEGAEVKNINLDNLILNQEKQTDGEISTEEEFNIKDAYTGTEQLSSALEDKTIQAIQAESHAVNKPKTNNEETAQINDSVSAICDQTAETVGNVNFLDRDKAETELDVNEKLYPDISGQLKDLEKELVENEASDQPVQSTAPAELELIHDDKVKLTNEREAQMKQAERERIKPLTVEQLNSLYHNQQLEANFHFINNFVENELKRESPEFYEILLNYQRARKNLLLTEAALRSLEQRYKDLELELWITETNTSTAKGLCGDNARCTKTITFEQARLNHTALGQLQKVLENIKEEIHQRLCLHAYSSLLSKLQVESYIHNLIISSPALYELARNVPVHGCDRYSSSVAHQAGRLKTCISVLFHFHRTPIEDEEMSTNLQIWTERLVSPLLRIGTFEDHLFILNHIMRCPAGIGTWAACFVQAPPIPSNEHLTSIMFGNTSFDHMITALSTVLIPTSGRAEFLCQMQQMFTPNGDKKSITWVMVDEDGEEDEDPQNAWLYLHENDVVAILKQFPLADIFRHIFFVVKSTYNETYDYCIEKTVESTMYRVYAFCTCLVRLFGYGLKTYSMARYRQLNKRLGRMIRQIVQYVSDHWGNFRDANQNLLPQMSMTKLQLEFDSFFLRAIDFIHTAQRLGSWQFIADMPFKNISKETMWKLLWLLYQSHGQSVDVVNIPEVEECIAFIQANGGLSQLADILQLVPVSEGVYLLNTMTNMTESCSSSDLDLIETVTTAIFEVSYVCPLTRDACSKMGRELLSAVVKSHPFILSKILQNVHENMDKLGAMGVYLYKSLTLDAWLPSDPDILILRQWLLNSPLGSHTHVLAQLILSNINWNKSKQGDMLMVPWKIHKQVSVLVVESYQRFIMGKHLGSVIMEGVKQMSAAVQQYSTPEQEFNGWCWDLLIKLSLHRSSLPSADQRMAEVFHQEVLDLNKDDSLLPLIKGNKENNATACFVTLLLTRYGHSEAEFLSEGIPLLQTLVDQGLSKPVIYVLYCTIPMFADIQSHLLENSSFQTILYTLLQSDESYFKSVKGLLSFDFPGPITKLLVSMIMSQVNDARLINKDKMLPIIGLWVRLLMKWPKWYQDRNYCYVLDQLLAVSFTYQPSLEGVQVILQEFYKQLCDEDANQGVVSTFVNWVTSGTYLPSFLEKASCPEFPWLAFMLLSLEGNYELDTKLWENMQLELTTNSKMTIDQALKKAKNKLKLEQAPAYNQLSFYRFAQQALDVPINHPAAVLTWQRFFILFLGRLDVSAQQNSPQRGSVGEKFLTGMSYSSMRKKLKKRLKETSDWYLKCTADAKTNTEEKRKRKDMLNKLARLYQTFGLWVEEPLLHDSSLYLPSLPPPYMTDRLLIVFQKNIFPWLEFIDASEIEGAIVAMASDWKVSKVNDPLIGSPTGRKEFVMETGKEGILSRLQRCEKPLPAPPVHAVSAPVPDVSPIILEDKTSLLHLIQSDMEILKQHAGQFCSRMAKQETLDDRYANIIPALYTNILKEKVVSLECTSMINPLHSCSKPGSAVLKFHEKCSSPIEQSQRDENRAEYGQLMMTNKLPPPQNIVVSAVHTENTITMLVKLFRSTTDEKSLKNINDIACTIFFRLGDTIDNNVQSYPPTQQFFTSCMDILGQNFIQKDPLQVDLLLRLAITRPELGGLLSPHFKPNINNVMFFNMYTMLLTTIKKKQLELTFMLLTKFDVKKWLIEHSTSKEEVKKFIHTLGQALCLCGVRPDDQHKLVFGLYVGHEKFVLQNRFPLYVHEVLAALLQGSAIEKLNVKCWTVFHEICFYVNETDASIQTEGHVYPMVFTDLSTEQITNIIKWLGNEFMQIRINSKDSTTFGLYPVWKRYVASIADLLRDLSGCLVGKMMPVLKESSTNDCIESLWRCIVDGFGPWLQVIYVSKVAGMPWIEADRETAAPMVKALRDVVGLAHCKTMELRGKFYNNFLSMLWLYFATTLCKADVTPSVISVFNLEFQQLPWKQLCPNIQVMETLAQLKEYGSSLGFNLVSDIVSVIDWPQVTVWYSQFHSPEINARYQGCLFLLLIQACGEKKYIENPDMENLLSQAESYKWENLPSDVYKKSCSMFLHDSDSKCILQGRTSPEGLGLRLLKSASGFNTEISQVLTKDWSTKRLCYLHTVSALICQCTFLQDWNPASFKTLIVNLLTEIETVESAVPDVYTQHQDCTDMVKEILTLLNNCNPDNKGSEVVLGTLLEWLQDSPQTLLLSPCIHAATRSVASLISMVQIVEACIELSFIPGGQRKTVDPWSSVLAAIQIPELNVKDFFNICLQESAFLLMHCYILQRLPLCQNLTEEQGLIETLLDWTERNKPSADNESKLLLWWIKILNLIMRQIDFGRDMSLCVILLRKFMHKIQIFGEDRTSGGLLGAIGLGKRSVLSEKFRLCSRAVVGFLSQQILSDNTLRIDSSTPFSTLPAAKQDLGTLLSLKTSKKYQPIKIEVETICDFVSDQSKCLVDVLLLVKTLRTCFYSDKAYLAVID